MIKYCPHCGAHLTPGQEYCINCGGKIPISASASYSKHCPNCGAEMAYDQQVCLNCGRTLGQNQPSSANASYNTLAIVGFSLSIASLFFTFYGLMATAAIICSQIAKTQIKTAAYPEQGYGLAKAGFIIGIVSLCFMVLVIAAGMSFLSYFL